MTLILSGSSRCCTDKPMNCYFQGLIGLAMVYFCGWFFHDLPANNGLLEAVDWEFPEDVLVNAKGDMPSPMRRPRRCLHPGMFHVRRTDDLRRDPKRAVLPGIQASRSLPSAASTSGASRLPTSRRRSMPPAAGGPAGHGRRRCRGRVLRDDERLRRCRDHRGRPALPLPLPQFLQQLLWSRQVSRRLGRRLRSQGPWCTRGGPSAAMGFGSRFPGDAWHLRWPRRADSLRADRAREQRDRPYGG